MHDNEMVKETAMTEFKFKIIISIVLFLVCIVSVLTFVYIVQPPDWVAGALGCCGGVTFSLSAMRLWTMEQ